MNLRDRIKAYCLMGGCWVYLESELIKSGMSESCARAFINTYRQDLGEENASRAIQTYDLWLEADDEITLLYLSL